MNYRQKYLSVCIAALLGGASPAFAAAPSLGAAADFAVLSAPSGSATGTAADGTAAAAGAVTCTDSSITGNVGSTDPADTVALTCTITGGAFIAPVATGVLRDYYRAYDALAPKTGDCDIAHTLLSTISSDTTLLPGTYCTGAALTASNVTLTLDGAGVYIFKIGTSGTGALTGSNFNVALTNGASACDVTWWVAQAATMTTTTVPTPTTTGFKGTILAGAAITMTGTAPGTPVEGRALAGRTSATAGVTLTDVAFVGCEGGTSNPPRQRCNQGVGNGPEQCDPGNSNQGRGTASNPFAGSNDEFDNNVLGTPGSPGKKGGNFK